MKYDARTVVFLDMDDVLCIDDIYNSRQMLKIFKKEIPDSPELWERLVDTGAAENLRQFHMDFKPLYVISSSWATYLDRQQMCEALTRTQLQFVLENLHPEWKTPRALSSSRRDEIQWWLEANREEDQPFIIIDDSLSGSGLAHSPFAMDGHVVLCRSGFGFTKKRLKQAYRQLQYHREPISNVPSEASNKKGGTLMKLQSSVGQPQPGQEKACPRAEPASNKPVFSASKLKLTPPRTTDEIRRKIRAGRFAEMTLDQAGDDD